jgi:hypothetical protein
VISLFWGQLSWEWKKTNINNALALDGRRFTIKTINQSIVGGSNERMMVRTRRWGGAYGGGVISLFGVTNRRTKKLPK